MKIGGQIIVRNTDVITETQKKKLVMIVGVLGCVGDFPLKGEHQYMVFGNYNDLIDTLQMNILNLAPVDRTDEIRGYDLGSTLKMPIWGIPETVE